MCVVFVVGSFGVVVCLFCVVCSCVRLLFVCLVVLCLVLCLVCFTVVIWLCVFLFFLGGGTLFVCACLRLLCSVFGLCLCLSIV